MDTRRHTKSLGVSVSQDVHGMPNGGNEHPAGTQDDKLQTQSSESSLRQPHRQMQRQVIIFAKRKHLCHSSQLSPCPLC